MRRAFLAALLATTHAAAASLPAVEMSADQQKTIQLHMAAAERRPITQPVTVPGTVTYEPGRVAALRPFGEARIIRLLVRPGDTVAPGQKLAEMTIPALATAQQDLLAADASVRESEAGVAVARAALNRAVILARDGSLAVAEADRRRLVLAQAQAALDAARAKVAVLRAQIASYGALDTPGVGALSSPINGIVTAVTATPGEVLQPGAAAITVADISKVMVDAQIPERQASEVAVNDAADMTLSGGGDRHWYGSVATLAAVLDPQARTLPARIALPNPDLALRIGMFMSITITSATGRDGVTVPAAAVQLVADKRVVFTQTDPTHFQPHEITPGVQRQDWVELTGPGIRAGEPVVTNGSFELSALLRQAMLGGG